MQVPGQSAAANHIDDKVYALPACCLAYRFGPAVLHYKGVVYFRARQLIQFVLRTRDPDHRLRTA
ncbi:hypothetical protein D9M70_568500 [compost metagenome]